jgi:hypothetical protein
MAIELAMNNEQRDENIQEISVPTYQDLWHWCNHYH